MTQRALHQNAPALSTQKTTDSRLPPPRRLRREQPPTFLETLHAFNPAEKAHFVLR